MYFNFGNVLIFLLFGAAFVVFNLFFSRIIRPSTPSEEKASTYECGELPLGGSWIQFNLRFYVIALIFLIFEVEVIFMFPWAIVLQKIGVYALVEMLVFIAILLVGFAYVWRKGDLSWVMTPGVTMTDAGASDTDPSPEAAELTVMEEAA